MASVVFANSLWKGPIECSRPDGNWGPRGKYGDHHLKGVEAFGAQIGIFQVAVLCVCSFVTLVLYLVYDCRKESSTSGMPWNPARTTLNLFTFAILLVAVYLLVRAINLKPIYVPYRDHWGDFIFIRFAYSLFIGLAAFVFSIIQYIPQAIESRALGHLGSFSLFGVVCQAIVMVTFGVSSYIRICIARPGCGGLFGPEGPYRGDLPMFLADGMFTPWTIAAGQMMLWWVVSRVIKHCERLGSNSGISVHEQMPLLG